MTTLRFSAMLAALGVLVVAGAAPVSAQHATPTAQTGHHGPMHASSSAIRSVHLHALNRSRESGTARLRDTPDGLVVALTLDHSTGIQPAHIHAGDCAGSGGVLYALKNVVGGKSTTTIPGATIAKYAGSSVINVHKSLHDMPTYVACGAIPK